jgi:hypothetical protein
MLSANKEKLLVPFKNDHTGSSRNDYVVLRVGYLHGQKDKDRTKKDIRLKEEQEVISKAIGRGGGEIFENCS